VVFVEIQVEQIKQNIAIMLDIIVILKELGNVCHKSQ